MSPRDFRTQIRDAYDARSSRSPALDDLAARIRATEAARRRRRIALVAVAACATIAVVAIVVREAGAPRGAGDPRLPPSLRGTLRVVDAAPVAIGDESGTLLRLEDATGAQHGLVEAPLHEPAPEKVELRLDELVIRTWTEDGRSLGLASPRSPDSAPNHVWRATALVSAGAPPAHPEDLAMSSDATTRQLLRLALVALAASASPVAVASPAEASAVERAPAPEAPLLVAVKFHADWCVLCKQMGTVFEDLADRLDGQRVLVGSPGTELEFAL